MRLFHQKASYTTFLALLYKQKRIITKVYNCGGLLMKISQKQLMRWAIESKKPPKLAEKQWNNIGLLGIVFLAMAVLQLWSFSNFKDWLTSTGMSGAASWAVMIVLFELLAAIGLFKIGLSYMARVITACAVVLTSAFWFIQNINLVNGSYGEILKNSGYFGRFLHQAPGWWTIVEVTILLAWSMYAVNLFKDELSPKNK
jgi:hypothetical protein